MFTSTHIPGKIFTVFRIALRSTAVTVLSQAQSYRTRVLVTVHRVPGLADVEKKGKCLVLFFFKFLLCWILWILQEEYDFYFISNIQHVLLSSVCLMSKEHIFKV